MKRNQWTIKSEWIGVDGKVYSDTDTVRCSRKVADDAAAAALAWHVAHGHSFISVTVEPA